jgi:hypothetical protein
MRRRLEALGHAIRQAHDPREILLLGAQRALLLARLGDIPQARKDIQALRRDFRTATDPTLAAWLWLAEGVADYFDNLAPTAREHVARAHALATSAAVPVVQALAAAWQAHLDVAGQQDSALVAHLCEAFSLSDPDHHAARARAALVMAWALHLCSGEAHAQPWYGLARSHAAQEGDGGTLGSVMHNMAALQVIRVRLEALTQPINRQAAQRALLSTESSAFLDLSIHAHTMQTHLHLLRAQILLVLGQTTDALQLYDTHDPAAPRQGLAEVMGLFLADRAWCLCKVGAWAEAQVVAEDAEAALQRVTTDAEAAIGHAQLAQVAQCLVNTLAQVRHQALAWAALTRHRQRCAHLQQLLICANLGAWVLSTSSGRNAA